MPSDADFSPIPDLDASLRAAFESAGVPAGNPEPSEPQAKGAAPTPEPAKIAQEATPKPLEAPAPTKTQEGDKTPTEPIYSPKGGIPTNEPKADDLKDPESLQMPKNIAKKDEAGWKEIKTLASQYKERAKREGDENKKLKAALAERPSINTKEFEALQKENEELRGLRSKVDIENDPEYVKTYAEPLNQAHNALTGLLKKLNVTDEQIAQIDFKNTRQVSTAYEILKDKVDLMTANAFMRKAEDYLKELDRNDEFLSSHRKNYKEFQATRQKESQAKQVQDQAAASQELERIASLKVENGEGYRYPHLVTFRPKEGATPEEIAEVTAHNKNAEQMRGTVEAIMQTMSKGTAPERMQAAVAAATAVHMTNVSKHLAKKNEELMAELAKISNAGEVKPNRGNAPKTTGKGFAADAVPAGDALSAAFPNLR